MLDHTHHGQSCHSRRGAPNPPVCGSITAIAGLHPGESKKKSKEQFKEKSMSRVSIKTRDDLPAELKPLWDKMTTYGAFENQAGVMAHRPPIFKHMWSLLVDLADEAVLSKRHLELALVAVSLLNKCDYCVSHHAPKLAIQGVSGQGAERLLDYKDHPELDDVDKLVVEYAIAVTNNWNKTRDEVFTRLRERFSEAQVVELTWRIALCGAFNRFNDILQFDIEQGVPAREAAE
jgi:uncharacterized peroxidase-related enzyme